MDQACRRGQATRREEAKARARVAAERQGHEPVADGGERYPLIVAGQRADAGRGHRCGRLARAEQLLHRQAESLRDGERDPQ
jgi:hypothetical protein